MVSLSAEYSVKGIANMLTKETVEIAQQIADLKPKAKEEYLRYLRELQDTADISMPLPSSQKKDS